MKPGRLNNLLDEVKVEEALPAASGGAASVVEAPKVEVEKPAAEKPAAADASVDDGSKVFSEIVESDLTGDDFVSTPEAKKPDVSKPAEKPKTVVEAPKPDVVAPAAQPEVKAEKPVVEQPKPDAAPTKPEPTEAERKVLAATERAAVLAKLTEQYAFAESEVPDLTVNPEKVLPAYAAKIHAQVMDHVQNWIGEVFPRMIESYRAQNTGREKAVTDFYTEWPELKDAKHAPTVARVLSGYRAANPDAKAEDVIREGGVAALVALRLPIPERVLKQHNAHVADATKPAAFPAASGPGAARSAPASGEKSPFEVIAESDLEDDKG